MTTNTPLDFYLSLDDTHQNPPHVSTVSVLDRPPPTLAPNISRDKESCVGSQGDEHEYYIRPSPLFYHGDPIFVASCRRLRLQEDSGDPRRSDSPLPTLNPQTRPAERTTYNSLATILNGRPAPRIPATNPRDELYRAIGEFNQNIEEVRRYINSRNQDEDTNMSSGPGRDLRRRFNRDPPLSNEPSPGTSGSPANSSSLPPLRSLGSRRESNMSTSPAGVGNRSRSLVARWANSYRSIGSITSDLADLDRNLESANSHLQALLDYTIENESQPYMSTLSPPPAQPEQAEESRRIKRRKLDSDKISSNFKRFRYGRYGQVEPGQLKMEIVSCDGGLYSSGLGSDATSYAVENILKNDASVYCTKGNRCNIVLRHQGATVFSLQELVIKAPGYDYSSPVREGMVFVSMNQDDLLKRTAQYQIQYVRPRRRSPSDANPPVFSVRHEEDGTQSVSSSSARTRRQHGRFDWNMDDDDEENYRMAQIPSEFNISPPPPFNVTIECSDDSGAEGAPLGRVRRRRTPNRIGALPFESDSSDEGAPTWGEPNRLDSGWEGTLGGLTSHLNRANRAREIASHYLREHGRDDNGLAAAEEASQAAMQEAVRAVGGSLMAPLAHFYIEKDKNKCTIRFDPPVSGRFILLKMWSPHHDPTANIDVQGVIAKGFAGPRYFPAVDFL